MASVLGVGLKVLLSSTNISAFWSEGETGDPFEFNLSIPQAFIKHKF